MVSKGWTAALLFVSPREKKYDNEVWGRQST